MSRFCTQDLAVHLDDLSKEGIVSLPTFQDEINVMSLLLLLSSSLRLSGVVLEFESTIID
jgi:hypothetical protein